MINRTSVGRSVRRDGGQAPVSSLLTDVGFAGKEMAEILVVDDEMGIRELLSEILGDEGHVVTLAENAQRAREAMAATRMDLVLLDIWMPDTDGVSLLKEWVASGQLTMPVIMMSGHATIETAVEATRIGAMDFLEKPIALQKLLKAVEQGLAKGRQGSAGARHAGCTRASQLSGHHHALQQHAAGHAAGAGLPERAAGHAAQLAHRAVHRGTRLRAAQHEPAPLHHGARSAAECAAARSP